MRLNVTNQPNLIDCLNVWLKANHPNWEIIDHQDDNWGSGVFIHLTHGRRIAYDVLAPHISVTDKGLFDCCGEDMLNLTKYDVSEPDFFEKLSAFFAREEEAYYVER